LGIKSTVITLILADDLVSLTDLDVYGDLLCAYGLRVETTLAKAAGMLRDLKSLNRTVINLYTAYILSKAGYYCEALVSGDVAVDLDEKLYTDKFAEPDWVEHWKLFTSGGDSEESWVSSFKDHKNAVLSVKCLNLVLSGEEKASSWGSAPMIWFGFPPATALKELFASGKAKLFVVHPALSKLAKGEFGSLKSETSKLCGQDVVLSTGEFRARFVNPQKLGLVEDGWTSLLERLKGEFQKRWPVVTLSRYAEVLRRAEEELRKASLAYEQGEYTHSVRDAAYSCECLLLVLYQRYGKLKTQTTNKLTFDDYLNILKDELEDDFGSDTRSDLNLIREMRNRESHPGAPRTKKEEALTALRRAQLFHERFKIREQEWLGI
jgi:uncharacterized protein (UPF0332 family)